MSDPPTAAPSSADEIASWLAGRLLDGFNVTQNNLLNAARIEDLGLSSVERLRLLGELEDRLGRELPLDLFDRAAGLDELAQALARGPSEQRSEHASPAPADAGARFSRFINPYLGERLSAVNMDVAFVRGHGSWLFDKNGRRYLDFLAGYGAVPFGHNAPAVWAAVEAVRRDQEPAFTQPAALDAASELARRLLRVAPHGLDHVTFSNSGAEAIEAAIKIARSATGKLGILSAEHSFHGKTLGALSATGNRDYQDGFGAPAGAFRRVPFGEIAALENALRDHGGELAAFLVEPIQGEGGIVEPPANYLRTAGELCRRHGVLFVLDEVQTGLGRTGAMFACGRERISPDILVLAKALGGGLAPIGATLCRSSVYSRQFGLKHSSTFAGNALAARIGLAVLDELEANECALIENVRTLGDWFKQELQKLQAEYPAVIADVRGRGLLLGLALAEPGNNLANETLLSAAAGQGLLTGLVSAFLLNSEGLRVAPALNRSNVIRLEPPLTVTREECLYALESLRRAFAVLQCGDAGALLSGVLDGAAAETRAFPAPVAARRRDEIDLCVLVHPTDSGDYAAFDPSLARLPAQTLDEIATRMGGFLDPFVASRFVIASPSAEVSGCLISVPYTAKQMLSAGRGQVLAQLRQAAQLGVSLGAKLIGLGAFTSIATRGGLDLKGCGAALTTGNAYTAVVAVDEVTDAARDRGVELGACNAAIVGAAGSVGGAAAMLLALKAPRLILIGAPNAQAERVEQRLKQAAGDLCREIAAYAAAGGAIGANSLAGEIVANSRLASRGGELCGFDEIVEDLVHRQGRLILGSSVEHLLPFADIVVLATSSPEQLIRPAFLKRNAIVCDVSRPRNASAAISALRPDVDIIEAGIVETPGRAPIGNLGLPDGATFACIAETIVLALDGDYRDRTLDGPLDLAQLLSIQSRAAAHQFRVLGRNRANAAQ